MIMITKDLLTKILTPLTTDLMEQKGRPYQ